MSNIIGSDRMRTVAFSGHRSFKMDGESTDFFSSNLQKQLRLLIGQGYDTFLCGMAEGFDMIAAGEVLELRAESPDIRLIAVVPYKGQSERFSLGDAARYDAILKCADHIEVLCERYEMSCFYRRNDFLIANSSCLLCYYNGSSGGTRYTHSKAEKHGLRIVNLCADERVAVAGFLF